MGAYSDRRQFLKMLGAGALSLGLPFNSNSKIGSAPPDASAKPNIILFFTDDQGTLDANCYGSEDLYTPNMDALAKRGVRLTQAYSHTVCCPARAPLLTGRHPQRCNVNRWTPCHPDRNHPFGKGPNMFLEELTLAEALKEHGYRTALFGKWHLGATPGYGPNEQGFDEFFGHLGGFIDNYSHKFLHRGEYEDGRKSPPFHDLYRNREEIHRDGEYFPDLVVQESHHFLEKNQDRPFFMYVALNVPHYPEQADARFTEMYKDLPMPRRSYAAMVSTADDRIGRILDKVDQLGLRENTLIFWMSDNGHSTEGYYPLEEGPKEGYYSAHGGGGNTGKWRGAKGSLLEGGIRVPAVISFPGRIPENEVRDQAVISADFFPTVLECCSISLPERKIDGKSLWPLIKDETASSPHMVLYWQWQDTWAVREGDWKLIVNGHDSTGHYSPHKYRDELGSTFLGNLTDEKPEWKNHAAEHPELVERLTRLHEEWRKDVMPPER